MVGLILCKLMVCLLTGFTKIQQFFFLKKPFYALELHLYSIYVEACTILILSLKLVSTIDCRGPDSSTRDAIMSIKPS